jgi:hypothetical protein
MNFGLEGKRAAFVGLNADLEAACARVLGDEGVSVAGERSAPRADIVVAAGTDVTGRAVADVLGPDELSGAWDALVRDLDE